MPIPSLVSPGTVVSLSPDTTVLHPFDVLHDSMLNYVTTLVESKNLSDRAVVRVPFTKPGEAPSITAEGEEIKETATNIDELTIPTVKIATIKTVSNELLSVSNSQAEASALVVEQAREDIINQADRTFFGLGYGKLLGIIGHLPLGIDPETVPDYDPNNYLSDGGTLEGNLDPFVDAISRVIEKGGREEDIAIIASPKAWAHLAKMKDTANGNRPLVDAMSPNFDFTIPNSDRVGLEFQVPETMKTRHLLGLPLFVTNSLPNVTGEILVFDRRNIVSAASEVTLTISTDATFKRDSTSFRLTYRVGWKVFDPSRITYIKSA